MAVVQIGLPWLALLLVWLFPNRFFLLFAARGEGAWP
jgi:hypothetical protein